MGSSNGKIISNVPESFNGGGEQDVTQNSATTLSFTPTNPLSATKSRKRTTITTFDKDTNRVSIVSIRYDKSPIAVEEDRSVLSFENYDLAMARIFSFLDITSLLMCASACKRFRDLEIKYQDVLWQNLYKFHKTNMMYFCTNPSQALQMMEETKKKHQQNDRKPERNELGLIVNDPILLELKKDVKNWKDECLNYYFVKRKFISSKQEYLLISKLHDFVHHTEPLSRRKSLLGQQFSVTESPRESFQPRTSESSDSSDDFKLDDNIDDDFLKKKSLEFMMYNNNIKNKMDESEEDEKPFTNLAEIDNANLNRWKEAESDSDDDNWLDDEKEKEEEKTELDLKSPNQILQEKIGISHVTEDNVTTPPQLRTDVHPPSSIKHFEETSDDEDWFKDEEEEKENNSLIEPIVKKGERASQIESQTKLHVKNDFSVLDNNDIKIEITSDSDPKSSKKTNESNHVKLKLPSFDEDANDEETLLKKEASVSEINLTFANDLDTEGPRSFSSKLKTDSFDQDPFDEDSTKGSQKSKSPLIIPKLSANDDESDPWYSDEEGSPKKPIFALESDTVESLGVKKVDETDSDSDDWYSESEDDKKSNFNLGMLKDSDDSQKESPPSKIGLGSNVPALTGNQTDTARRIKEAENLTLDELITDLTDVTKLKETYLNLSNAETQQFYSKLLSFHQRTQALFDNTAFDDTMPDSMMMPSDWPTTLSFFQQKKGQGIVIKLVYIEDTQTPYPAKLCNPVLKFFGSKSRDMKNVCSALIIGPFLLQWNKTHSLIIPRKLVSDSYLYQTRTHRIAEIFNVSLDSIIDSIAKVIVEWNLTKLYHDQLQNCQHFVEKIIDVLGIKKVLECERIGKTIFNYNTMLQREGKGIIEFNFSDQVKQDKLYTFLEKKYGTSKICFETHQQLDEFMRSVISEDPNFTITHHQDYSLLVFFDQLFWAKHNLLSSEERYKPFSDEKSILCPFGSLLFGTTK
ncbi:hypothetical protein FDP41_012929 [Naegleria fowleri]|uniref:F-box domain-containing protein n=1 Tax=Naegleria fowleri TaxID=5763 RepID=A0A6A5C286_NAEFO|nr:uncharacterized protein FDP41_012929 [Naegleria fowleri]KAF0981141.1 hypothetical protein FDP41_012929 [Naegleria fowleri]